MKKIFTLCAAMLISAMSFAQMPGDPNAILGSMVLETATITGNGAVAESDGGVKRLDNCYVGTIVTFALNNATEQAYDVTYTQGTCMDGIMLDFEIVDANNDVVWTTQVPVVNTALKNNDTGVNFEIYETETVGTTAVLPAGNYILNVYYNRDGVKGTYNGSEFDFTCNVSDITFTAVAGGGDEGGSTLPEGAIELSWDTMDKDDAGTNAADQNNITFNGQGETGFVLKPAGGRTQAMTTREGCSKVLNFKNNTNQTLVIPEGTKVYKINFYGWSQGDNWTYLYAYGPSTAEWEFTSKIGSGVKDNTTIIEQAEYPLDPCVVSESYAATSPVYHNAGYCFASLDFSNEPYEGEFCFVFNGNNQERAWMVVYTTAESAAAAESAEAVKIGKENSQKNFLTDGGTDGIESAVVEKSEQADAPMYNIAGQMVTESYKGIVIKNGKKYLNK